MKKELVVYARSLGSTTIYDTEDRIVIASD